MFYEVRRKDRLMDSENVEKLIKEGEYGVFSTVGKNGYPYGVPVNYCYCDGKIYFHGAKSEGSKLINVRYCDKVCFTIVGKTEVAAAEFSTNYESVVIFGTVKIVENVIQKEEALKNIIYKYSSNYVKEGMEYISKAAAQTLVYEVTPEHITGKNRK